jgi:hypothetical protein
VQGFGYGFRNPGIVIANKVIIIGNNDGLFVYSGSAPTLGGLIASIAAQPGTDSVGNAYLGAGLAVYGSGFTTFLGQISNVPELVFKTNLAFESTPGNIAGGVVGAGVNETMQLLMSGPKGSSVGGRDWAQVYLISNDSAANSPAVGQLRFINDAQTVLLPFQWDVNGVVLFNPSSAPPGQANGARVYGGASHLKYVANDANAYNTGHVVAEASGATTINLTTNIPIAGTIVPVIAGTYLVRGYVHGTNGAVAATQAVSITGPAASNFNVEVDIRSATANSYKAFGEITSSGSRVGTAALAIGEKFVATYSGIITFTAAGNVQLGGSCVTAAADTWTADATSHLILEPVT